MILMIIKGLFRRYERWNPVHPTSGAFWGMGIGIGCGVGWGPGFGPEVIGYVGAGCGVGFSVGITLAGVGIGLPANFLLQIPYNTLAAARSSTVDIAWSSALPVMKKSAGDGWSHMGPHVACFKKEAHGQFQNLSLHASTALDRIGAFRDRLFPPKNGMGASST